MCIRKYSVCCRSGSFGSISRYRRLYPLIFDQGALIVELRESIQCCRPVIPLVQSNRHEVSIVLSENDSQILRTQAILVICVIPDLCDLHRGLFTCNIVRIRDRRICACRRRGLLISGLRVACRHRALGPRVCDQNTIRVLRKTRDRCFPVVARVQLNRLAVA